MKKRTKRWSFQGIQLVIHPQHATVEGRVRIHEEPQVTVVRGCEPRHIRPPVDPAQPPKRLE